MMKRIFALLTVLSLTLMSAAAFAEPVKLNEAYDVYDFYLDVPEGAVLEQEVFDPGMMGMVTTEDLPCLFVMFSLMPDDSYTETDMKELSADEIANLIGTTTEDMGEVTSELYDMPCGLKALSLVTADKTEYYFMALKDGHFLIMEGIHIDPDDENAEIQALTDTEVTFMKTLFDSLTYKENVK